MHQLMSVFMAEKEGFEPSRQLSHPTPLAGEPLRPLGYFSMPDGLAEREGFEPPVPFDITGFQDQRLKPLGHLSPDENRIDYYSGKFSLCQCLLRKNCGNFAGLQCKSLRGKGAALTDAPGRAALQRKTGKRFFVSQCNAGKYETRGQMGNTAKATMGLACPRLFPRFAATHIFANAVSH